MREMTKRRIGVVVALVALFTGPSIAAADSPRGVTPNEFFTATKHWTKARTEAKFDVTGQRQSLDLVAQPQWMTKTYPQVPKFGGYVFVKYERDEKGPWRVARTYWCEPDQPCMPGA